MSQTKSTQLSGALHDAVLVPLASARRDAGAAPYFPAWKDESRSSYFETSGIRRMSAADFEFPGAGTADGLVNALIVHWTAHGESALAAAGPHLKNIAQALRDEAVRDDGSVDIFCYTLF